MNETTTGPPEGLLIISGLRRKARKDGKIVLCGDGPTAYTDVDPDEEPLLELLDGHHTPEDMVRGAMHLDPPLRPVQVLSLLRRLHRADMLLSVSPETARALWSEGGRARSRLSALARRVGQIRLPLPFGSLLFAPGAILGAAAWKGWRALGGALVLSALIATLIFDQAGLSFDPFVGNPGSALVVLMVFVAAMGTLSLRGLARGLAMTGLGLGRPPAVVAITLGIPHLDCDDRERRAADAPERALLFWTGLATLAAVAGAAAWIDLLSPSVVAQCVAAVASVLLLADLAPYARTDSAHLIGIAAGIPSLGARSASYLLRRAVQNLARSEPISRTERIYLAIATAWLSHAFVAFFALSGSLVPGALIVIPRAIELASQGPAALLLSTVGLIIGLSLLLAFLGLIGAALWAIVGTVLSMITAPRPPARPTGSQVGDARARELLAEMRQLPFLADVSEDLLVGVIGAMTTEDHGAGAVIIRQGDPGDRFCYLQAGRAQVLVEERESGLQHAVATLAAGDFFGEVALIDDVPRTATVRAVDRVTLLTLERAAFQRIIEGATERPETMIQQIRNAAFLRRLPLFASSSRALMTRLLEAARLRTVAGGETIVEQGQRGDALYIVRSGGCHVEHVAEEATRRLATLSPGQWFGEIALLRGGPRTATVRAAEDTELLEIPADAFAEVLLDDFAAAQQLERLARARYEEIEVMA